MIGRRRVTIEARKPPPTAFEFDGNYVEFGLVMKTASLGVNIKPVNIFAVNNPHFDLNLF